MHKIHFRLKELFNLGDISDLAISIEDTIFTKF